MMQPRDGTISGSIGQVSRTQVVACGEWSSQRQRPSQQAVGSQIRLNVRFTPRAPGMARCRETTRCATNGYRSFGSNSSEFQNEVLNGQLCSNVVLGGLLDAA